MAAGAGSSSSPFSVLPSVDSRLVSFTVERRVLVIIKAWAWHQRKLQMRKPGKRSRESNAYFYPNHKDEKNKYSFKVLVGDFRERLAIPDKFIQHFRGLIANSVKLESRCGHTFDVEVAKNLGKVVLQTGWKEFVTAHDLNMGDSLVFKYNGTSRLEVFIFDLSCCEKVPPYALSRETISVAEKQGKCTLKFQAVVEIVP